MNLGGIKESYIRKKEIPFSSEQKWMAVKCSLKNEVSLATVETASLQGPDQPPASASESWGDRSALCECHHAFLKPK